MFLDTNYLIGNGQSGSAAAVQIDGWLLAGEALHTSAIAWAEFLCGPLTTSEEQLGAAILHSIHPTDAKVASLGATLFNATGRRSRSLPDCLIAATAILAQQPLATLNRSDFEPFVPFGLTLA
jgi:predicted nucleic acid-binding protein